MRRAANDKIARSNFLAAIIEAPCLVDHNNRHQSFLDESLNDIEWDLLFPDTRDDRGRFKRAA